MNNNSGRRKAAVARVYLKEGNSSIVVNKKPLETYFPLVWLQNTVQAPFVVADKVGKYDVQVNVAGGGISGQAQAIRLGIAKALVDIDAELKSGLRHAGFITRDPRVVERKKSGQKKARKRFQFSKR